MPSAIEIVNFDAFYGKKQALKQVNLTMPKRAITALIGPSGCGKTTLLRSINRLNDLKDSFVCKGHLYVSGKSVYEIQKQSEVHRLRQSIGMVFQQANLLPDTIINNVLLPLKEHYKLSPQEANHKAEAALRAAALWEEVKDRLHKPAMQLSGGQQQRLCIARALILEPEVLLLDEPCSALDPISTDQIEQLLIEIKHQCSVVIVTHNMEQAARISDQAAMFYMGELVEVAPTKQLYVTPRTERCANYIMGKF